MNSTTMSQSIKLFGTLPSSLPFSKPKRRRWIVTMRDRSNNPRPLQKGRNLSIEAIQTVQALKRVKKNYGFLEQVFDSKFRRLLKFDMMAVLKELLRQNESLLALKVFEDVRREHWYKPRVILYADIIQVLGRNDLFKQIQTVYSYLKSETTLQPEIEGFNALLRTLIEFGLREMVIDSYNWMKQVECEPDRTTFRILVHGLESMGDMGTSAIVRLDAQKYYGESLEFLEEKEQLGLSNQ